MGQALLAQNKYEESLSYLRKAQVAAPDDRGVAAEVRKAKALASVEHKKLQRAYAKALNSL